MGEPGGCPGNGRMWWSMLARILRARQAARKCDLARRPQATATSEATVKEGRSEQTGTALRAIIDHQHHQVRLRDRVPCAAGIHCHRQRPTARLPVSMSAGCHESVASATLQVEAAVTEVAEWKAKHAAAADQLERLSQAAAMIDRCVSAEEAAAAAEVASSDLRAQLDVSIKREARLKRELQQVQAQLSASQAQVLEMRTQAGNSTPR